MHSNLKVVGDPFPPFLRGMCGLILPFVHYVAHGSAEISPTSAQRLVHAIRTCNSWRNHQRVTSTVLAMLPVGGPALRLHFLQHCIAV